MRAHFMLRRGLAMMSIAALAVPLAGCDWEGLNSLPLPGTAGRGSGSYTVTAELPDVSAIEPNSRVRVGDVTVGTVTKVELSGWHAKVTMRLQQGTQLPANATAALGQTSLLGSLHIELAPPKDAEPEGRLHDGSVIPLSAARSYPTTEQTLAAVSMFLNGGGLGQIQDITGTLSTAMAGRENDVRNFLDQANVVVRELNSQTSDITAAIESLDRLVGQFAADRPVVDKALKMIPDAVRVLKDQRDHIGDALEQFGQFSALTTDIVTRARASLLSEVTTLGVVAKSLADAGPSLTRSLSILTTFPYPKEQLANWMRGDYGNATGILDLTLNRIDTGLLTGTRWEGSLTALELQWGRTMGQTPSPYTAGNPLIAPYHADQGP